MGHRHARPVTVTGAVALAGVLLIYAVARGWPWTLFDAPFSVVLESREGDLLCAKIAGDGQWRFPPLDTVPHKLAVAIQTAEDRRFLRHPGVDPLALLRALRQNTRARRVVSGASTITMQVVRLSRGNPSRTVLEKAKEMALALALERRLTKEQILSLYASHAPFGGNVVGVSAAGWRYFGRGPDQLSWGEASLLAVLPNNPALIHPGRSRAALQRKRDLLLDRLSARGHITPMEADLAKREPLPVAPQPLPRHAAHLLETLKARWPRTVRFKTTLSRPVQADAEQIALRHMERLGTQGIAHAALLVIDHRAGEVLAYVGNHPSRPWNERAAALDLVRRPRSTGSVLKPFLYAAMLEEGELLPDTLLPDRPMPFKGFAPENFDRTHRGAVPAWMALARSLNIPAAHMLARFGVGRFAGLLKDFGMTTLFRPAEEYGLPLIIGGAEGTLWDLTNMTARLAVIARAGSAVRNTVLPDARLFDGEPPTGGGRTRIGPGAAWLTLEALREASRPGVESYWKNFAGARPVAWKTGTSWGHRDGWAIGSDGRHSVGVWTGNAEGDGRPDLTGTGAAAPLMFEIFNRLDPGGWWDPPDYDLKEVAVCRDNGYLPAVGCETTTARAPLNAHFDKMSPHHTRVHLDTRGQRVHSGCESVDRLRAVTWFALPASQAVHYQKGRLDYRPIPPWRADCRPDDDPAALDIVYPAAGARMYWPNDFNGEKSRAVFRAVHADPGAVLFWHLDDDYAGHTRAIHEKQIDIAPGAHTLTVVDEQGRRRRTAFTLLGPDSEDSSNPGRAPASNP